MNRNPSRESPSEINQAYLVEGGTRKQLTKNEDFTPDLTRARRERFIVERPDGFKFRVTVTLPADYRTGTRLPAMFWFYPREYPAQDDYDRGLRTFNNHPAAEDNFDPAAFDALEEEQAENIMLWCEQLAGPDE